MKKIFKYIFFFTFLFTFGFVNDLSATDDDWLFYCDYKLPWYDNTTRKIGKKSFRAYVYSNNTAKFFDIDKEVPEEIVVKYGDMQGNKVVVSDYYFDTNLYYSEAVKNGKYSCPSIGAELNYLYDPRGYKIRGNYELTFDRNENINQYPSSGIKINPKLEGTQQGEEIDKNADKITHQCSGKSMIVDKDNGLRYSVEIILYMKSSGKKYIQIKYGSSYYGEAEYNSIDGAAVDVIIGYYPTPSGSFPIKDRFMFYGEDNNIMFNQNTMQIQNNTFNCPTVLPKIGIDKSSANSTPSGNIVQTGGIIYIVAYSQKVMDNYGKDGTFHETTDMPLDELMSSNSQIISSNRGTCEFYLGNVKDEDSIAKFLDQIYTLIKIGSIILVIILTLIELAGTVSGNKDNLTEVLMKGVKRLVILVIILLLPTFIDIIGNIFGYEGILCGIK